MVPHRGVHTLPPLPQYPIKAPAPTGFTRPLLLRYVLSMLCRIKKCKTATIKTSAGVLRDRYCWTQRHSEPERPPPV